MSLWQEVRRAWRKGSTRANDRVVVQYVVDGDTLVLQGGQRVRLIGVDAPERGERGYEDAKACLTALVLASDHRVALTRVRGREEDHWGRWLVIDDFIDRWSLL